MTPEALRGSPAYAALLEISARAGADPLQVQAAGGNTSLKAGPLMAIKASGTWLAEAQDREIMITVEHERLRAALDSGDAAAERAADFTAGDKANGEMRPSIETSVHAVFDLPVVLHTHCVETIAVAVRADAEQVVRERLGPLGAVFVPYVKPGVDLAREIRARATPRTPLVVLGNHGLVAAGETPETAAALLSEAARRLRQARGPTAPDHPPAPGFAKELEGAGWAPAPFAATHAIAFDPARLAMAGGRTLYPDHLIFLGPGATIAREDETVAEAAERGAPAAPFHRIVIVPGRGAAVPTNASPSVLALARALGDVLARVDPQAELVRLTAAQESELLDWDAEKYRQSLQIPRGDT